MGRKKHHVISHHPRHRGRRYLQCTMMGWFPVLLCTLSTSSMTSVMVARLVHTPSGDQLVMWNWVTCCIWVLCVFCADQSQIIIRYMLHVHLYTIMRFSQCTNSRQSTHTQIWRTAQHPQIWRTTQHPQIWRTTQHCSNSHVHSTQKQSRVCNHVCVLLTNSSDKSGSPYTWQPIAATPLPPEPR